MTATSVVTTVEFKSTYAVNVSADAITSVVTTV